MQIPVVATVSERAENHQNYKTPICGIKYRTSYL